MFHIPPPQNWQSFEDLCKDLWGKILQDKNVQLNGRAGQLQCGVDIYGIDAFSKENYGIQCKQKTFFKNLTAKEINSEVEKAKNFTPKLDKFIIATTAQKDVNIEKHVRELNNSHKESFLVYVYGWEDILSELYKYEDILTKHYSMFINQNIPESHYFNFWFREAVRYDFSYNACYLPFSFYNIKYSYYFVELLRGYLNKHDVFINGTIAKNSHHSLKLSILKFNISAKNLLQALDEFIPKESNSPSENDLILTYWVDCKDLTYLEKAPHIASKKNSIRLFFYNLIERANDIISIWNTEYGYGKQFSLIEFAQLNPNFGLFGDLYLIEPHYPKSKNGMATLSRT